MNCKTERADGRLYLGMSQLQDAVGAHRPLYCAYQDLASISFSLVELGGCSPPWLRYDRILSLEVKYLVFWSNMQFSDSRPFMSLKCGRSDQLFCGEDDSAVVK